MTDIPEELRDFAELMVDEVLARLRVKIEDGGWSIEEQREIIAVCIAEQDIKRTLRADNAALREAVRKLTAFVPDDKIGRLLKADYIALLDRP